MPAADLPTVPGLAERYTLQAPLGSGAQARTFRAHDSVTGRDVAVKLFRLGEDGHWKRHELFERECRVLRSLDCDGVPKYLAHGSDPVTGTMHLVTELVDGVTLQQRMTDGHRMGDDDLRQLFVRLLRILQHLHQLNPPVYHRDIKPSNVLVEEDGTVSLIDFGGVRDAFRSVGGSTVVGTTGYMAPEQAAGEASSASDLYGLACTIAAVATGVDASDLPRKGLELDLEACMKPGRLRDVLLQMLRPDPRDRVRSAAHVRTLLSSTSSTSNADALVPRSPRSLTPYTGPLPTWAELGAGARVAVVAPSAFVTLAMMMVRGPVGAVLSMLVSVPLFFLAFRVVRQLVAQHRAMS